VARALAKVHVVASHPEPVGALVMLGLLTKP
jgi:hypothetical protein